MFLVDLLVALLIALFITAIFLPMSGGRAGTGAARDDEAAAGIGVAALFFFAVVFLAAWAGGVWLRPVGATQAWGVSWLGFLVVGLMVALLILAVTPGHRAPGRGIGGEPLTGTAARVELDRSRGAAALAAGLGIFFWVLLVSLIASILVAYLV